MVGYKRIKGVSYYQMLLAKNKIVLKDKVDYAINVKHINEIVANIDPNEERLEKDIQKDMDLIDRQVKQAMDFDKRK